MNLKHMFCRFSMLLKTFSIKIFINLIANLLRVRDLWTPDVKVKPIVYGIDYSINYSNPFLTFCANE